jgi:tRNA-dihydrouridine synthase
MLAVPARACDGGYVDPADWGKPTEIRDSVGIPVAGNGDVTDGPSARRMLDETGCEFVMVGRAAEGDPHIFTRIAHYLETGEELPAADKLGLFEEYYELARQHGIRDSVVKKQAMGFTRGTDGSKVMRQELKKLSGAEEVLAAMREGLG